MSHDLYFCARDEKAPSRYDLLAWGGRQPFMSVEKPSETDFEFFYDHPDTGVNFAIDFHAAPDEAVDEMIPEGVRWTGLSFNMNYIRPSFFAPEAMPVVKAFADAFGLLVVDPQETDPRIGRDASGREANVDQLVECWTHCNRFAIRAIGEKCREEGMELPPYMSPERSTAWWKYMHRRESLQEELGDDVYVPGIFLLTMEGREVLTSSTWAQGIPNIFPETDFVIVQRTRKKLFGLSKKDEMGYVKYGTLMRQLAPCLDDVEEAVPLLMLTPEASKGKAAEIFRAIEIDTDLSPFQRIPPGGFVDVKP